MQRIVANDAHAVYRTKRRVLLPLGLTALAAVIAAHVLGLSWTAQLALAVLAVACTLIGLSSERLSLDFKARRLHYESRFAGFPGTRIDDDLDMVRGVMVSVGAATVRDRSDARSVCRVMLRYAGESEQPIVVAVFDSKEDAVREAQFLSERMRVSVQLLE